jgi:hypothetical protein
MKSFLIITLTGFLLTAAVAQEPVTVLSADIVDYGIFRIGVPDSQREPAPSAEDKRVLLVTRTNQVPASVGTMFGFRFVLNGKPAGALADTVIVVEHPAFKKPGGEASGTVLKVPWRYRIGEKVGYFYTFDDDWEAVPGVWRIGVWRDDKKLAGKEFVVKRRAK